MDIDRIADPWGTRTPYGRGEQWPIRVDTYLEDGVRPEDVERWVQSASTLHSNGDAFDYAVIANRIVGVRGRADDRVNRGRLGPKDLFGWQAIQSPDRLTRPLVRQGGDLVETDWDTAMQLIVDRVRDLQFRNVEGGPLIWWTTPEEAFEAWKQCSAGRPCDYTALTYAKLRGGTGVQWPCNEANPDGTERLFADGKFWASPDLCETFGRDMITGAPVERVEYAALNPTGKAVIRVAEFVEPSERPTEDFPYQLTTGRTLYHFHTRTRTDRAPQLHDAAPDVWVEISVADAESEGIDEGDMLRVETERGAIEGRARVTEIRPGVLFVPFHYGDFDLAAGRNPEAPTGRAANELTRTQWDPVSKQPLFKVAAARISVVAKSDGFAAPAPMNTASEPATVPLAGMDGGPAAVATEMQPALEESR